MNLLQSILGDNSETAGLAQIAQKFGLNGPQTISIANGLLPLLAQGFVNNSSTSGGISSLLNLIHNSPQTEPVKNYAKNPELLQSDDAINHGNSILGQLFGSKQVSTQAAQQVATETGVEHSIIKKILPLLAIVAFNAIRNKTTSDNNTAPSQSASGNDLMKFLNIGQNSSSPLGGLLKML